MHIPYPSSPEAMTSLIRGDAIACLPAISVTPSASTGKVKILAVSTAKRSGLLLPDVPTLKEAGIDVEADAWMGMIAPAKHRTRSLPSSTKKWSRSSTSPR